MPESDAMGNPPNHGKFPMRKSKGRPPVELTAGGVDIPSSRLLTV